MTNCISEEKLQSLSPPWKTAYASTIISKTKVISDPDFNLNPVQGKVVIREEVTILASQITVVKGLTITGHHKHVHVFVELSPKCTTVFILENTSKLKPGNSHIEIVVINQSRQDVKLKPSTEIGTITATNIVPTMKVSNEVEVTESERVSSMSAKLGSDVLKDTSDMVRTGLKDILQKLDLSGMKNWEHLLQKAAQELISEFACIFSQDDLYLGRTSIVKYSIKVNDSVLVKELYRHIPPGMYE